MAQPILDLDALRSAVLQEIERRQGGSATRFRYWRRWPSYRLYATLDVVYLWRMLAAPALQSLDRAQWIAFVNGHQRPDGDYDNPDHDRYHRFAYTLGALTILDGIPRLRPRFLAPLDPEQLRVYLAGLHWKRPIQKQLWGAIYPLACTPGVGPRWGDVLVQEMGRRFHLGTAWRRVRYPLPNWLYISQLYHVLLSYDALGKPFPQADALLQDVLARGLHLGSVFLKPRTACTEMDWVWVVEKLSAQSPARAARAWHSLAMMNDAYVDEWYRHPGRFVTGSLHDIAALVTAVARLSQLFPERYAGEPIEDCWNDHALFRLPASWNEQSSPDVFYKGPC